MIDTKYGRNRHQSENTRQNGISRFAFFPVIDPFTRGEWLPRVDVSQDPTTITVFVELPDINKDDIHVTIHEGRYLAINGEKRLSAKDRNQDFYLAERAFGLFDRIIELPAEVDETSVEATYHRGVLKIAMHKISDDTKRIPIQSE
ncbi:MAG: Hsp20/alpha crystallin family protein [Thermodesulfobacteriota bacterium]